MAMTKEARKQQGIEFLKEMKVMDGFIENFEKDDYVTMFERCIGYWVYQYPEIEKKMREIEEKYKCTVYAITHEYSEFGELYDFLIVTNYKCEWKDLIEPLTNITYRAYAYVWNKDDDSCSEFGSIAVRTMFGGLNRVG